MANGDDGILFEDVVLVSELKSTSAGLLARLKSPNAEAAWALFAEIYSPLIFKAALTSGMNHEDALDVVQDVMAVCIKELPHFEYDPKHKFRSWIKRVTVNRCIDQQRRNAVRDHVPLLETEIQDSKQLEQVFDEKEYTDAVVNRCLRLRDKRFEKQTWDIFWSCFDGSGRSSHDIARQFGVTANVVHLARSRILRFLRTELDGLIEGEE